jgi:hypothetical protein
VFFIAGFISSAVATMSDVPKKRNRGGFSKLPIFGSRASILGWYSAMDDALRDGDTQKIIKLYEAGLSMPMRLRLTPSKNTVVLDSLTFSEDLWTSKEGASDSFWDFVVKVMAVIPTEPGIDKLSAANLKKLADTLGLAYHATNVSESMARSVKDIAPFTQSPTSKLRSRISKTSV